MILSLGLVLRVMHLLIGFYTMTVVTNSLYMLTFFNLFPFD